MVNGKDTLKIDCSIADDEVITTLDASGLRCPLPLLKAKQVLAQVQEGDCVRVLATDAGSVRDFHTFAELAGHRICKFQEYDGTYEYILKKGTYV